MALAAIMCFSTTVHAEEIGTSFTEAVGETSNENDSEDVKTNEDSVDTKEDKDAKETKDAKEADKTDDSATNEKTANEKTADTTANGKAANDKATDTAANEKAADNKTADTTANDKTANDKASNTTANDKTANDKASNTTANDKTANDKASNTTANDKTANNKTADTTANEKAADNKTADTTANNKAADTTANEKSAKNETADPAANNTADPAAINNTGDPATNEVAEKIPDEVNEYAQNHYKGLIEASISYYPELESENVDEYKLQPGYVVYDGNDSEAEIYYYPVSLGDKIVMVLSVVNTSEGLTISGSEEMVEGLNEIDYEANADNTVFYENGDGISAENEKGKFSIEEIEADSDEKTVEGDFTSLELNKKIDVVAESAESKGIVDIDEVLNSVDENSILEYAPAYKTDTSINQTCKLYYPKGQNHDPICWAASIATIVNYRRGLKITAYDVCKKINMKKLDGANNSTSQTALGKYKLKYKKFYRRRPSVKEIKRNIKEKNPIFVGSYSPQKHNSGHAVTLYGWEQKNNTMHVAIWNSGLKGGKGDTQIIEYNKKGGTVFSYAGRTYVFSDGLANYLE